MDRDISPEERLLRLIKNKSKKKSENPRAQVKDEPASEKIKEKAAPKETSEPFDKVSGLIPQFRSILLVNKVLFVVFILVIMFFLIDYFFLPAITIPSLMIEEGRIEQSLAEEPVKKPYSYYQSEISGKDLFKPLVLDIPETKEETGVPIEEIIANLSLLGLVSGASPQAIIEDKKMNKTFFLRSGESLGDVTLKEISEAEGRVVLIYNGEEFDLGM